MRPQHRPLRESAPAQRTLVHPRLRVRLNVRAEARRLRELAPAPRLRTPELLRAGARGRAGRGGRATGAVQERLDGDALLRLRLCFRLVHGRLPRVGWVSICRSRVTGGGKLPERRRGGSRDGQVRAGASG